MAQYDNNTTDIIIGIYQAARLASFHGEIETAAKLLRVGLDLAPKSVELMISLANVHLDLNDWHTSLLWWEKIQQLDPQNQFLAAGLAYCYHMLDNTRKAFEIYEDRLLLIDFPTIHGNIKHKVWRGEDLKDKKVVVVQEGGYGDMIQFSRFIPEIKRRGGDCYVLCEKATIPLFQDLGVTNFFDSSKNLDFTPDYYVPILSFPYAMGIDKHGISGKPFLKADPKLVKSWYEAIKFRNINNGNADFDNKKKIGIVWAGNPEFVRAAQKIVPIEMWKDILETPNCDFYSLQMGKAVTDLAIYDTASHVMNMAKNIKSFADTAAIIENMDLIITIDTAVAHLAGALGKPVWTMLHRNSCWRWQAVGEKSYYYDSMTLLRQNKCGDWSNVLSEVKSRLNCFAASAD